MIQYVSVFFYKALLYFCILIIYIFVKFKNIFRKSIISKSYLNSKKSIQKNIVLQKESVTGLYSYLENSIYQENNRKISSLVNSKDYLDQFFLDIFQGAGYDYILEESGFMSKYFWLNYHKRGILCRESKELIVNFCKNKSTLKILDIGCGSGTSLLLINKLLQDENIPHELYGCDLSPYIMIEAIHNLSNKDVLAELVICNGEKLPYKNDYFDIVINYGGINQFQNIKKGLNEMIRVVKKNGLCICRDEYYNSKALTDFEKIYFDFIQNETVPIQFLDTSKTSNITIQYLNKIQFLLSFVKK